VAKSALSAGSVTEVRGRGIRGRPCCVEPGVSTPQQRATLRRQVRRQHGVVSLEQSRAAGLSDDAVQRRVSSRAWWPAGPRVYRVGEHDETPASRTWAAMLSLGEDAVLVGRSAAWWHGFLDVAPARVEVAVGRQHQPRERPGVRLLRREVDPVDRTRLRGLAVTTPAPTVLDAAVALGLEEGARLMDRALLRRRVDLAGLHAAHERRPGRHGAVLASRLLALADGGARSEAERRAHRLVRRAGLTGWRANGAIDLPGFGNVLGDMVFDAERVVLEIDGWAYHRDLRAFLRDGPRQSALTAAGWVVLRTHWYELHEEPDAFLRTLRRTLAARSRPR
jgi:very-short-patch-repair endonuclease